MKSWRRSFLLFLVGIPTVVGAGLGLVDSLDQLGRGQGLASFTSFPLALGAILLFSGLLELFLAPSLIALYRDVDRIAIVVVLNLFLGWTLVGWVSAFVQALSGKTRREVKAERDAIAAITASRQSLVSPDGRFYWDGQAWHELPQASPSTTNATGGGLHGGNIG